MLIFNKNFWLILEGLLTGFLFIILGLSIAFGLIDGSKNSDCVPERYSTAINIPYRLSCELTMKRSWK